MYSRKYVGSIETEINGCILKS